MTTAGEAPEPQVISVTPVRRAFVATVVVLLVLAFAAAVAFGGNEDGSSDRNTASSVPRHVSPPYTDTAPPQPQATATAGPLPLPYTDPNAKIQVFDHATGQLVTFTEREWYEAALPYMPHPGGSLVASVILENGSVRADYYERVVIVQAGPDGPTEVGATGREVPFEEAQLRVEAEWQTLPPVPGLSRP